MKLVHITCKEATFLIVKNEDAAISLIQRLRLRFHLTICNLCKRFQLQNKLINHEIHKLEANATLTPAEKEKIRQSLLDSNKN